MFIVELTYKVDMALVDQHISAHIEWLSHHYETGMFLASGRKIPRTGGVILVRSDSREMVDAVLQQDPFYREGIADFQVTEIQVSKTAEGLEKLISA